MATIDGPRSLAVMRMAVVLLLVVALASGCGRSDPPAKVYRHSLDGRVSNVDPIRASTIYANYLVVNLYDTLYAYRYLARPYALKPNLAAAMPQVSADGLVYTIPLRQGVYFIDDPVFEDGKGREMVARDVVYSFNRHFAPDSLSQGAWLWGDNVASISAPSRYTVRIELARPFPQLVHTLAHGFSAVVPREAVEFYGPEFGRHPVGSGPFRLASLDASRAVLTANAGYRREPVDLAAEGYDPDQHAGYGLAQIDGRTPPFVDRVEVWFQEESAVRWESFRKGDEIQYLLVPGSRLREALAISGPDGATPSPYHRLQAPALEIIFHTFNFDFPEIGYHEDPAHNERNRKLRCALVKSFDWSRRNALFYYDMATVTPGAIPPGVAEFDPAADRAYVTRDIDAARALLREAGWNGNNLPEIVYAHPASSGQNQLFEQFRAFLVDIDYPLSKVVPRAYPNFAAFVRALKESDIMVSNKSWTLDYPDLQNVMQQFYGPNRAPGSNDGNYANAEYDRLYEQAAVLAEGPERTAIYRQMNDILMHDCAIIGSLTRTNLLMWHDDVVLFPDRNVTAGFALKYVDLRSPADADAQPAADAAGATAAPGTSGD